MLIRRLLGLGCANVRQLPGDITSAIQVRHRLLGFLGVMCAVGVTPLSAQTLGQIGTNQPSQSSDATDRQQDRQQQRRQSNDNENNNDRQESLASDRPSISDPNARSDDEGEPNLDTPSQKIKVPAKPSEFERYVKDATGRTIERFGTELLVAAARDFAVPAVSTVPPDYALNVGDEVSIALSGSIEGSANFTIDTSGRVFLPKVGSISLVGVRFRDLKDRIISAVGLQYRGFQVSVGIRKLRGVRVYVTGFANNPGAYTVNSLSTLVNAVLAAGGPNSGGSFRSVKLIRNGVEVSDFDLYELLINGDRSNDALLQNEDVLFIPPAGQQAAVIGSTNKEAIYETRAGETIAQLLKFAGGPNTLADTDRLVIYSLSDKNTVGSREITRDQASRELTKTGDIVQILSRGSLVQPLDRQKVLVRIEGEVNRPGNYHVASNTPMSVVVQMAGGLTPRAFVYGTVFTRASTLVQQRRSFAEAIDQVEAALAGAPLTGDSTVGGGDRVGQIAAARAVLDKLRDAEPDGRLVLSIPYASTELPSDLILENNDHIVVPPRQETVGVFGSVYRPATFRLADDRPLRVRDYIERAGGRTLIADRQNIFVVRASGDVLTRRRGALSARVQPGDVVFVPVKTQSSSIFAKIRDISAIIFQLGIGAAALAAIR